MIGQVLLGRYTVHSVVGEGGMGVVYRAVDDRGQRVAIKRMHSDYGRSPELLARFEREASVQAMLNHPNIAGLYAAGATDDGALFVVMELVEGGSLADALRNGPLPLARAIRIATEVLSALHYAHQFGLVHRDLKPENVLLTAPTPERPVEQAKVIDFGLVKLLNDVFGDAPTQGLTVQGSLFGTPQYMSPEHITGEPIDARSDLYAMGVLLFVMLTGHAPFENAEIPELWRAHLYDPVPSLAAIDPALDDANLDAILSTLLAKRPEERFETAQAARRALQSITQ